MDIESLPDVEAFGKTELGNAVAKDTVTTTLSKIVPKLRCELITKFEQLEQLSSDWERLWKSDPAGEVFQSFAWARAWWRAYGSQYSVHCLAVYDDDTVIGILPLVRYHGDLRFLGTPQADYTDVLCEEARALDVLTTAFSALHESNQWNECKLERLPAQSRIARYWRHSANGLQGYSRLVFGYYCQTIIVPTETPDLLKKIARTKRMRRYANKLSKLGDVKFRFIDTRLEAREHLRRFFRYQARRRILIGDNSGCHLPTFQCLLEGLVDELDPATELRFGAVEVNGSPVAYHFCFNTAGKFTLYQQTFDVNAWDYHPGNVLLRHMLLYASEKGAREFDFTIGVEPYKTRYINSVKQNLTLYLERRTMLGLLRCFWRAIQGTLYQNAVKVKIQLLRYPRIYEPLAAVRKWIFASPREQSQKNCKVPRHDWSLFARIRRAIWKTEDRLLFRVEENTFADHSTVNHEKIDIALCQLSDIADVLLENHDFPGNLHSWKRRIAKGDQLLIVRENGKVALGLWTTSDPTAIGSQFKKYAVDFDSSRIVYEHWSSASAHSSRSYRAALAFLVNEAAQQEQSLWVYCPATGAQKRDLVSHGFHAKYRFQNWWVLHWLRYQRVSPIKPGVTLTVDA
jgi:CelD/BcsL family acetyltransferase involved in cellulose biosynthesis